MGGGAGRSSESGQWYGGQRRSGVLVRGHGGAEKSLAGYVDRALQKSQDD